MREDCRLAPNLQTASSRTSHSNRLLLCVCRNLECGHTQPNRSIDPSTSTAVDEPHFQSRRVCETVHLVGRFHQPETRKSGHLQLAPAHERTTHIACGP